MAKTPALGILLPVQRGSQGYYNQGFDAITQVRSNLTNLILTKKGERIMQPDFGCAIHEMVFDELTDDFLTEVRGTIEEAVQIWLPFVIITDLKLRKDDKTQQVFIGLSYQIKSGVSITDTITLVLVL